jgi:glycosyltransferase involved in cell wall biosynthesis
MYGVKISNEIEGLKGMNYKALKNYFNFIKPHGIAFGVIKEAMGDYDMIIGGNWDSVSEVIETIFFFTIAKLRKNPLILYQVRWKREVKSFLKRFLKNILNLLIRYFVKYYDAIVPTGTKSKEYFIELGANPNKIFMIFNASKIDTMATKEEVNDLRKSLEIVNKKVILYVGRLIKGKKTDILIKAFYKLKQEHNNSCLIIVGEGECKKEFQNISKELNIENDVLFLGRINNKDLPVYYSLCNIFVLPSSAEPWGLVLNEAMQFGKPVIATDGVGAAYDLIKDGVNGFIVQKKNINALYNAMEKILSDPELEKEMGEESKKIIEEGFTYENMVEGFRMAIEYVGVLKGGSMEREL